MKKKSSFLILALLIFVLFLGVGYAVVSSVGLQIGGTADVKDTDLKVAFNGNTETSDDTKVNATAIDNSLSATIEVKGLQLNETVTATYYIKNMETDVDASVIVSNIENNKNGFFEVSTDFDTVAKTIEAGGVESITVTIRLIKTPIIEEDSEANIKIILDATPIA